MEDEYFIIEQETKEVEDVIQVALNDNQPLERIYYG